MDEYILRSITNDSGRVGSRNDDHAGEMDSEDPPRIYNLSQHRRIVLATSTQKSHPAGENKIHEWAEIETLPTHTNCLRPDRDWQHRIGKGRTIGLSMTSGDH